MTALLNRLTIRRKIAGAFGFVLLLLVGLGLTTVNRLSAINDQAADIRDNWLPSTGKIGQLLGALQDLRVYEARYILAGNDHERQQMAAAINERLQTVERLRQAYEPMISHETDDERLIHKFDQNWTDHKQAERKYLIDNQGDPHDLFNEENRKSFINAAAALQSDLDFNVAEGKKAADRGAAIYATTRLVVTGVVIAAITLCLLLAYGIINNVSGPIRVLTRTMTRLAGRDWSTEVPGVARKDELGEMARALNVFKTNGIEAARLTAEQKTEQAAKEQRTARLNALTEAFDLATYQFRAEVVDVLILGVMKARSWVDWVVGWVGLSMWRRASARCCMNGCLVSARRNGRTSRFWLRPC